MEKSVEKLIETLNPDERKIIPHLKEGNLKDISKKAELSETKALRALQYLSNKEIVKIDTEEKKIVKLDRNGVVYLKHGLPERRLLNSLTDKVLPIDEAKEISNLSKKEFKASLGALKKRALIKISRGKIILEAKKDEIIKKSLEEKFIEELPLELDKLKPEQKLCLKRLKKREKIIEIKKEKKTNIELTKLGKKIISKNLDKIGEMIETITPEILKKEKWRGKKFRRYDIKSPVPKISGGKRHFVNQAIDSARKIWTEMGFKEMTGNLVVSSFWNFDALFTAQDHPVRDLHDTFFIKGKSGLPDKKIVKEIKKAHEEGVEGSKGWGYKWDPEQAKKLLIRTHTTCLSSQTLAKLKKEDLPAKYFAIGKCFRNETIDWSHGFEFNQTEGIVIDKNANFRHLLGYLKQFAKKMGYDKVRFRPAYFPYTEPSVEGDVWDEEKKEWIELIAAGIFRPEVTKPLLGEALPVLAWGPGFDRMIMKILGIKDLRDMYKNDLEQIRRIKFFIEN